MGIFFFFFLMWMWGEVIGTACRRDTERVELLYIMTRCIMFILLSKVYFSVYYRHDDMHIFESENAERMINLFLMIDEILIILLTYIIKTDSRFRLPIRIHGFAGI